MIKHYFTAVGAAVIATLGAASNVSAQTTVSSRLSISGSCSGCDLSSRDMSQISLNGANFSQSNFSRSNLSGGQINHSNLTGAQFTRAFLIQVQGEGVIMRRAIFHNANLSEAALNRSDFSDTDLRRADLSLGSFKGADFSKTVFSSGEAMGANFSDANFSLAKLHHTNFQNAIFIGAKLKFAEFGTADVNGADFTAADFSGANLLDVHGLTQAQLDQGCGSPSTQIPAGTGLTIAYCPEYLKVASSGTAMPRTRSARSVIIDGVDVSARLDQLDNVKAGLRENIYTIERAIAALPPRGSHAARAELEMSKKHLQRLYNGL
ncbi:MAG: pentapeptide repeat-containing protein [Robiginitomaculum sp.]